MIGILLIYWIWKGFTNLAIEYDKNKWGYFGIGLLSYYGGTLMSGFIIGLLSVFVNGLDSVNDESFTNIGWNLLFVLCGGLTCYGVYRLLERKCEKEKTLSKKEGIENIGVSGEN